MNAENPYAAPEPGADLPVSQEAGQMNLAAFERPARLVTAARVVLSLYGLVLIASVGSAVLQLQFIQNIIAGNVTPTLQQEADANDRREIAITVAIGITFLLSAIVTLRLLYKLRANVGHLGATGLDSTPGWTVGWFFVPIANLIKPPSVVSQVWKASRNPDQWEEQATPMLVVIWWASWLVSILLSRIETSMMRVGDPTLDQLQTASMLTLVSRLVILVATVAYAFLLSGAARDQQETFERISTVSPEMN